MLSNILILCLAVWWEEASISIEKVKRLKKELEEISGLIDEVTDENFFKKFERITFLTESVKKLYESVFSSENINENEKKELEILVKQIKEKFDNMIGEKQKLSDEIKRKLSILQNQKKISNYSR